MVFLVIINSMTGKRKAGKMPALLEYLYITYKPLPWEVLYFSRCDSRETTAE
jgi:hypothetical protein